jgi:pimeloyl-ACP methyl ester carboxylesterase
MIGLLILFSAAAVLLIVAGTAALLYDLYHPQRKTLAFALAHHLPADPAALGLAFVEREFRLADRTTTPGWVIEGTGGPIVVVSHDWSGGRFDVLERLGPLPQFASRIIIYDLRAHGDSTARTSGLGTKEVDDLLAIVDQLEPRNHPVVLLGYGLGAGVSIAAAAREAQGTAAGVQRRMVGVIAIGTYRDYATLIAAWLRRMQIPRVPFFWLLTGHLWFWLEPRRRFDRAAHAARVACPLLVLQAMDDPAAPLEDARVIARAAPHAEIIEFPGATPGAAMAGPAAPRYLDALQRFCRRAASEQATDGPTD